MKKEKSTALVKFEIKEEGINKVHKLNLNDFKVKQTSIKDKRTVSKTELTTKVISKAKWEEIDNTLTIELLNSELAVLNTYIVELEYLEQLAKDTLKEEETFNSIIDRVEMNLSKAKTQVSIINSNIVTQNEKYKLVESALTQAEAEAQAKKALELSKKTEEERKEIEKASKEMAEALATETKEAQEKASIVELKKYGYFFADAKQIEKFEAYRDRYKEFSYMNLQGKQTVSSKTVEPTTQKVSWEHMSFKDFREFTKSDIFYVINENTGNKQKMYFCEEWLENEWMRIQYRKTTFNPSPKFDCPKDVYNFWEGYVEPIKGDVSKFINHVDTLIEGTKAQKEYLIKLLAYSVRYPHIVTGTTIALFGDEGSGKSTLSLVMAAICPNHYYMSDSIESVMNGFNGETLAVKYFLWEEALWGGSKKDQGKFKHFVTGKERSIEIKGMTKIIIPNYAFHIFTSNNEWLVPVDRTDRRNNIYKCSNKLIKNYKYFEEFTEWLNGDGKHAIMNFFLNEIDLTGFNPRETVETDIKIDVKLKSLDDFNSFMMAVLSGDITDHALDEWSDVEHAIGRDDLFNCFTEFHSHSRMDKREFSSKLAVLLNFQEKWKDNWKRKVDGKSFPYYKLPAIATARDLFAKILNETTDTLFNRSLKSDDKGELRLEDLLRKDLAPEVVEPKPFEIQKDYSEKLKNAAKSDNSRFAKAKNTAPAKKTPYKFA